MAYQGVGDNIGEAHLGTNNKVVHYLQRILKQFFKLTKSQSALYYYHGTGALNNISIKYSYSLKQASLSCHLHPLG